MTQTELRVEIYIIVWPLFRFNIMLAVDEFNGSFSPTTLRNQQKEWV